MNYDVILIRYGELALKGKNRDQFEDALVRSVKSVLRSFFKVKVRRNYGRMYVELHGEDAYAVMERLKRVFGISSFSPTIQVDPDIETIKEKALELIRQLKPEPHVSRRYAPRRQTLSDSFDGSQPHRRHAHFARASCDQGRRARAGDDRQSGNSRGRHVH